MNFIKLNSEIDTHKSQLELLPPEIKVEYSQAIYSNATTMIRELTIPDGWNGVHVFIQLMSVAQTPYSNVERILVSQLVGKKFTVTFQGSGFVSGHVIGFKCLMIRT